MQNKINIWFDAIVFFLVAVAVSWPALHHDLFRPITTTADPDIVYIYQVLLLSDGLPQSYFDHTGYIYFVILTFWFKLLHLIGLVPIIKLSELVKLNDIGPSYEALIYGGRIFSIILATLCSFVFYYVIKKLTDHKYIAAIAAIIFAILPGLSVHAVQMRTELPSIFFAYLFFLMMLLATQSRQWVEFVYLALAAFFAVLAIMAKLQIIPTILAMPIIILILCSGLDARREPAFLVYSWPPVIAIGLLAIAVSVPAHVMTWTQIFPALPERHNVSNQGYQFLIMSYLVLIILVYVKFDRRTFLEMILIFSAVSVGFALAFYTTFIHHDTKNTAILVNFVEHMTNFATSTEGIMFSKTESSQLFGGLYDKLALLVGQVITRNLFTLNFTYSPTMPLAWLAFVGIAISSYYRNLRLALSSCALLATGFGMEVFSGIRSFAPHYRIYSEPLLLLSVILLVVRLLNFGVVDKIHRHTSVRWGAFIFIGLIGAVVIKGSLSFAFADKVWNEPSNGCYQTMFAVPRIKEFFCSDKFLHPPENR